MTDRVQLMMAFEQQFPNRNKGTSTNTSLLHAVFDLKSGALLIPPHQREHVWDDQRRRDYMNTIREVSIPPGSLEYYQLELPNNRVSPKYLNDGCQRLKTAAEALDNPSKFGMSHEEVKYLLENTYYPLTLTTHKTHREALDRFQKVNNNLQLTPYQISIGDIVYCEGDQRYEFWVKFINDLHQKMLVSLARACKKPEPNDTEQNYFIDKHKLYRHNLSLLLRYLTAEKRPVNYKPGAKTLNINSESHFEIALAKELADLSRDEAIEKRDKLINLVDKEIRLFLEIKKRLNIDHISLNVTACRCLLDIAIWRRNNRGGDAEHWINFLEFVLPKLESRSGINEQNIEGTHPKQFTFSLSRVQMVKRVCDWYGLNYWYVVTQTRKPQRTELMNGLEHSHKKAFSKNGEGATFPEASIKNRSRGARAVNCECDDCGVDLTDNDLRLSHTLCEECRNDK